MPAANKGEPELIVLADPDAVAAEAADRIAAALVAAVERRGRADFCTTGGTTPIPIYRLLAESPLRDRVPWSQVHFWFGDDRFVPRDHPESNVTALDDVLLGGGADAQSGAPLPAANIHPFPTDRALAESRDTDWCADRYAEEMAAHLPPGDGQLAGLRSDPGRRRDRTATSCPAFPIARPWTASPGRWAFPLRRTSGRICRA